MDKYEARHMQFRELIEVNDWQVKIYTISKEKDFDNPIFYKNVIGQLPAWLGIENGFNSSHEGVAFLIIHVGREGIFSLINWWVGDNMLNTNIYLTKHDKLEEFDRISGNGLGSCVWELDIMHHESTSWLKNMLMGTTNLSAYLEDVLVHKQL